MVKGSVAQFVQTSTPYREVPSSIMESPPPYEEAEEETSGKQSQFTRDKKAASPGLQRFSLWEEVGVSRSQNVAAVVPLLLQHVRERARSGLANTTMLLISETQGGNTHSEVLRSRNHI